MVALLELCIFLNFCRMCGKSDKGFFHLLVMYEIIPAVLLPGVILMIELMFICTIGGIHL